MITIENLNIQFDVEGNGDEAVFTRLFVKYIEKYDRLKQENNERQQITEYDRSLGD